MTQDEIIRSPIGHEQLVALARDGIQSYLSNGGLFNPDEMNHDKVRELIMLCRDALDLVAAHEREECAKVCAEGWKEGIGAKHQGDVFAVAIRARGENGTA